jgi:hypothetical protein
MHDIAKKMLSTDSKIDESRENMHFELHSPENAFASTPPRGD